MAKELTGKEKRLTVEEKTKRANRAFEKMLPSGEEKDRLLEEFKKKRGY
jgi:hypothetical protein